MKLCLSKVCNLPILALISFLWVLCTLFATLPDSSEMDPPFEPLASPQTIGKNISIVAGTGLIESASREIAIGSHLSGVVKELFVREGEHVAAQTALFALHSERAQAQLAVRQAQLSLAYSHLADAQSRLEVYQRVQDQAAIAQEELNRRHYAFEEAKARLQEAQAHLQEAEAYLALHTVRAPIAGQILQINLLAGSFAQAGILNEPLLCMGDTSHLNARIDVDEFDLAKLRRGARVKVSPKGNSSVQLEGELFHFAPFVKPKNTLSGAARELVDTRILQLIFRLLGKSLPLLPGQQVDAYIESDLDQPPLMEGERQLDVSS